MDHTVYERLARIELRLEMLAAQATGAASNLAARQQMVRDGIRLVAIAATAALIASGKVSPELVSLLAKAAAG